MPEASQIDKNALNRNLIERVAMGDMLRRRARDCGNREAVIEFIDGKRIAVTFRQLNSRVNRLVRGSAILGQTERCSKNSRKIVTAPLTSTFQDSFSVSGA